MLRTYCEVGLEIYKRTKDASVLDDSMKKMKQAEELLGDPEISNQIRYYERRVADF